MTLITHAGANWIGKIQRKKVKHIHAKRLMNELIERTSSLHKCDYSGMSVHGSEKSRRMQAPILIAAKMGVREMVEKILDTDPVAIHEVDSENKSAVLLAIENRQPHVYSLLNKRCLIRETALRQVDKFGNSALHLAATYRSHKPWRVPGAAMQMQWEYKWYKVNILLISHNHFKKFSQIRSVFTYEARILTLSPG